MDFLPTFVACVSMAGTFVAIFFAVRNGRNATIAEVAQRATENAEVNFKLDNITNITTDMNVKIQNIENSINEHNTKFVQVEDRLNILTERVEKLEDKVDKD